MPDANASSTWIAPLSALAGVALKSLLDWVGDSRKHKHESREADEERARRVKDRAALEQRQLLLQIHKSLHKMLGAASNAHSQDQVVHTQDAWTHNHREPEVTRIFRSAQARTAMLTLQLHDEEVTKMIQDFRIECTLTMDAKSRVESDTTMSKALATFYQIVNRSHTLIREFDSCIGSTAISKL